MLKMRDSVMTWARAKQSGQDQALAARWMLKRRRIPSTLYFGMAKDEDGRLTAHAWLRSGSQTLTGAEEQDGFTVLATFADIP